MLVATGVGPGAIHLWDGGKGLMGPTKAAAAHLDALLVNLQTCTCGTRA
jgi:hypothetical protein